MMCAGIALPLSELPAEILGKPGMDGRVHTRGGEREVRFLYRQCEPVLPVWHEGRLQLVAWGGKRNRSLPRGGWVWQEDIEDGQWQGRSPEPVDIPAAAGWENGIWFKVQEGMRGVIVVDERRVPAVYLICEPSSHYYQIMTKSKRMPVLIGERI
jgi:hypothetical protein